MHTTSLAPRSCSWSWNHLVHWTENLLVKGNRALAKISVPPTLKPFPSHYFRFLHYYFPSLSCPTREKNSSSIFPSSCLFEALVSFIFLHALTKMLSCLCPWSAPNFLSFRTKETLNCCLPYHWHNPNAITSQWTGGPLINMWPCEEFHWSLSRSLNLYMFHGQ